ncbi:uncharacterized protein LOC114948739 isoform X2 [Acropora millepora]|nr:uncharacterized protein LOC114948739 isoform X2 [Acropora millepora]
MTLVSLDNDNNKFDARQRENGKSTQKNYSSQISCQEKKDLHTKLDEILLGGLHGDFEFCPGHAVDRLEMVQFLTSVVHRHLQDFPELQQILDLRDTVLTSRVKRAFPGVEYKRKQVKEDNGKKVWLYVNIRRKSRKPMERSSGSKSTDIYPSSPAVSMTTASTPRPLHVQGDPPSIADSSPCSPSSFAVDGLAGIWRQWAPLPSDASFDVSFSREDRVEDEFDTALDGEILPKCRLIPRKSLWAKSVGHQNPFRGITPLTRFAWFSKEPQNTDETELARPTDQSENVEEEMQRALEWKIWTVTEERDQALQERNQALAAFMEMEKKHSEAIRTIEMLRLNNLRMRSAENASRKSKNESRSDDFNASSSGVDDFLCNCRDTRGNRVRDVERDESVCSHERCDFSLLQGIAKEECDFLLKRLEIVKGERNSYLNRLHALEKDNQRLRDSVCGRHSGLSNNGFLDISLRLQTTCQDESSSKEPLKSVLSHLRSKRKQVTPSRLNKFPKCDHSNLKEGNSFEDRGPRFEECLSPSPSSSVASRFSSPWKQRLSSVSLENGIEKIDDGKLKDVTKGNLGSEEYQSTEESFALPSSSDEI